MRNRVNCWNPKAKAKAISSQAKQGCLEGSTTRARSPERMVKLQECAAPEMGEDIV
jgi:hypothetical protein